MIPSSEDNDRKLNENKFADKVGRRLSGSIKTPELKFVEGEVVIFLGFVDRKGSKVMKYVYGSQVEPSFKEKVCDTAMDIILSDPDVRLFKDFPEEDIDI
jgi:hypothetical protein